MIIKHHNIAMNKEKREDEEHLDAWNIFRRAKNENFQNFNLIDLFSKSLKNVIDEIY